MHVKGDDETRHRHFYRMRSSSLVCITVNGPSRPGVNDPPPSERVVYRDQFYGNGQTFVHYSPRLTIIYCRSLDSSMPYRLIPTNHPLNYSSFRIGLGKLTQILLHRYFFLKPPTEN